MLKIKGLYLPMLADRIISGDVYFLNSSAANTNDDSRQGKDPDRPFATLDYALSQMTAGQGDYLIGLPGHAETMTAAGSIDVAGIHIIGCLCGGLTPTFTGNAAVDCISIDADDVEFNGFRFGPPGTDAQTANINIAADSAVVKNIYAAECSAASNVNIVNVITITADGDNCLLENITLYNKTTAVTSFLELEGAASNVRIRNFNAFGDVATAGITDTAKIDYLDIDGMRVCVVGSNKPAAVLDSNPEGVITNAFFGGSGGTTANVAQLGNLMRINEVWVTNDVDGSTQGYKYPAIDSAS